MSTPKQDLNPNTIVDHIISDDLAKYLSDSDTAAQIIDWIHKETSFPKIYISIVFRLLAKLVVLSAGVAGKWLSKNATERLSKIVQKVPYYNEIAGQVMKLKSTLDNKNQDRQLLEKILSGERPVRDAEFGDALSAELRTTLKTLSDTDEIKTDLKNLIADLESVIRPQPSLELKLLSVAPASRLNFRARRVPFIGREYEKNRLQDFLNAPKAFSWWIAIGSGGMGKSRLALEFCLRNGQPWRVGFLPESNKFADWVDWEPDGPTLIIIDYAAKRTSDVRSAILSLAQRNKPFPCPVRFLILERDAEGQWYDKFLGSGSSKYIIEEIRFDEPLNLPSFSEDDVWGLASFVIKGHNKTLPNKSEFLQSLRKIDPECRPLYGTLAAEAVVHNQDIYAWDKTRLLDDVLEREENEFWLLGDEGQTYKNLLALATMTGHLPIAYLKNNDSDLSLPSPANFNTEKFEKMSGSRISDTLPPLEPDIIGEYFVLKHLDSGHPELNNIAEKMRRIAWKISPSGFADFLNRCIRDFHDHKILAHILKCADRSEEETTLWSILAINILYYGGAKFSLEQSRSYYEDLKTLATRYKDSSLIRKSRAKGTVNLITICANKDELPQARELYDELAALAGKYPDEPEIRLARAQGTVNLIAAYANKGEIAQAAQLYNELATLAGKYSDEPEIRLEQAKGAFNLINDYANKGKLPQARELYDELAALAGSYPDEQEIRLIHAKGAYNLILAYGNKDELSQARKLYDELAALAGKYPDEPEIRPARAKGAVNLISAYGNKGEVAQARKLYDELAALAGKCPDEQEIRLARAQGAANLILAYGNKGEVEQARELYDELAALAKWSGPGKFAGRSAIQQ